MTTNHLMLSELLKTYHPEGRGIISKSEMDLIIDTLCLDEMDVLQLRNLRDFTVLFLTKKGTDTSWEDWDRMSAITTLIDIHISQLGGEV
jgi:hypothetical protein